MDKETWHIEIEVPSPETVQFNPGDVALILPKTLAMNLEEFYTK